MNHKKIDFLRFNILKFLKTNPTHGYDLYLMLKKEKIIKDSSKLYKILRSLNSRGLIAGTEINSEKGPTKTVFELTEAGLVEYYLFIVECLKIIGDLLFETQLKIVNSSQNDMIDKLNIFQNNGRKRHIFCDFDKQMPLRMKIFALRYISQIIPEKSTLYMQTSEVEDQDFMKSKVKKNVKIQLFNKYIAPRADSMNTVIRVSDNPSFTPEGNIKQYKKLLKDEGNLVLVFAKNRDVKKPVFFQMLLSEIFADVPKKMHNSLKKLLPAPNNFNGDKKNYELMTLKDLIKILKEHFKEVEYIDKLKDNDIVYCNIPKKVK
ncbi:MAG: hypothetical protein GF364_14785 [Candidatus Lokiarchaeota archaeon]|nr:hypothetical protein [Candidatus Lokiarchaeota archaeon]